MPKGTYAYLTVPEVAERLRVSKMTVYRLVDSGEMPSTQVGRSVRIPVEGFDHYLSRKTRGMPPVLEHGDKVSYRYRGGHPLLCMLVARDGELVDDQRSIIVAKPDGQPANRHVTDITLIEKRPS